MPSPILCRVAAVALAIGTPAQAVPPLAAAPDYAAAGLARPTCADGPSAGRDYALPDLVDLALCRAPATSAAWASVRSAQARQGQVRALYGPAFDARVGPEVSATRRWGGGFPAGTDSAASATASLSLGWLLYDFGGRQARLSAAEANRAAALAAFADQAQAIVLETGLAYNALLAAQEAETAADASLRFARVSLDAATARERAGVGVKSDRLQADAAFSRAELSLRRAQGQTATQRGRLASAVSLPPDTRLDLARPAPLGASPALRQSATALITEADRLRPDLQIQSANLDSARANVGAARADRRPSISLGAGPTVSVGTRGQDVATGTAGVTLAIPLGNSGGRTWAVREAEAEADRAAALLEDARQSAALDVWSRYQALATEAANLDTARRLLASAEEAAALAQGRYRAGLASITELLDAQSSLASAREQLVAADFGVRSAELQLARSVGRIGETVQ